MIKRIIFLVQNRFNFRDYQRFGIELLEKNKFDVEVWDLFFILHPELLRNHASLDSFEYNGLTIFKDRAKLYKKMTNLSHTDFIINFVSYNFNTLNIYKALSKSQADYAVCYSGALPNPAIKKNRSFSLVVKVKSLINTIRPESWKGLFVKLPSRWFGIKPIRLILAAGERSLCPHYPVDNDTEILQTHTFDYDLYLEEKDRPFVVKPTAVFLDTFFPFHPDYLLSYGKANKVPIEPDRYFDLINNFFDLVEKKTGLRVIIAAHPRSNYESLPDYFKGRECVKNKTVSLIKECKLVLSHASTAVNLAALFYKPVIFITCSKLDKTYEDYWIREMAKWFGKKVVLMNQNNNIDWNEELTVSKSHYDNYRSSYIKMPGSEEAPLWQIVANRLKHYDINDIKKNDISV